MKKRLFSITTAVYMLCLLTVTSCSAAEAPASGSGAGTTSAALLTAFTDIPSDAAYAQAVAWCKENGLMAGVGGSRFAPDGTLTRAMLAAVLYRAAGSPAVSGTPAFSDVEAGAWYANAAIWASEQRLIRGYGNNIFGTNDPVTKEQLTVILGRYIGENPVWTGDTALAVPATRAEVAMELYLKLNTEDNAVSNTSKPMEDWIGTQDLPGENEEASKNKINISFNGHTYSATLADNSSAKAFADMLKDGPLTISTHDYGGFEKVGALGTALPRNDEQITTSAGDIILYQGDQITVYYAQNTWNFTRLGRMDDPSGLQAALGGGDVSITFSLAKESGTVS